MNKIANPECDRTDCEIKHIGSMTTLLSYTPVYDREGNMIHNGDPNTVTDTYHCRQCNATWMTKTHNGISRVFK